MVMDSGPYPFGRSVLYVVPDAAGTRVFKVKDVAMAAAEGRQVFEFVETCADSEYFLAYVHVDGREERVMDMSATDEGTVTKHYPDVTALSFGRYGDLTAFTRDLEEFKAFWARVRDAGLFGVPGPEARFVQALRNAGRKLAYDTGGYVAMEELDEYMDPFVLAGDDVFV